MILVLSDDGEINIPPLQLALNLDQLQSYEQKHSQAISELQTLIAHAKRFAPSQVSSKTEDEGDISPEDQAPALVLIDCSSMTVSGSLSAAASWIGGNHTYPIVFLSV
jgi:hypothetical protein